MPNLRALLATYPFISTDLGLIFDKRVEDIDPNETNKFLLDLNRGYHDSQKNPGDEDPTLFAKELQQLNVVYGTGIKARDAVIKRDEPDFITIADPIGTYNIPAQTILPFTQSPLSLKAPESGEIWYKELEGQIGDADKTVILESAIQMFLQFPRNNVQIQPFPKVAHGDLPYDKDIQKFILDTLGINLKEELISTELRPVGNVDLSNVSSILRWQNSLE